MDATSFRILETLSAEIGTAVSIRQLTETIAKSHGSAYYANIYNALKRLARDGLVRAEKLGNTSIVRLNFGGQLLTDTLAQVEIEKKRALLTRTANAATRLVFAEIEARFFDELAIASSISAIRPERNQRLNRVELLILVKGANPVQHKDVQTIQRVLNSLQRMHQPRIDYLILSKSEFIGRITSGALDPAKEMLSDKVAICGPQNFWHPILQAAQKGAPVRAVVGETGPHKISEQDLVYNMARFGYSEMGTSPVRGLDICTEYTVAAMLAQGSARRKEAVPVLLAKNAINYEVLVFIAIKYGLGEILLGLVQTLADMMPERKALQHAVQAMEEKGIKARQADRASIREKLRLYNAA